MEEHDRIADSYEEDANRIQEPSDDLKEDIKETEDDWDQKTQTESVPGAMPLPDEKEEPDSNYFEYQERTMDQPPDQDDSGDDDEDEDDS
jgi:hypothetical protein